MGTTPDRDYDRYMSSRGQDHTWTGALDNGTTNNYLQRSPESTKDGNSCAIELDTFHGLDHGGLRQREEVGARVAEVGIVLPIVPKHASSSLPDGGGGGGGGGDEKEKNDVSG